VKEPVYFVENRLLEGTKAPGLKKGRTDTAIWASDRTLGCQVSVSMDSQGSCDKAIIGLKVLCESRLPISLQFLL
jgi:hypothetical protein